MGLRIAFLRPRLGIGGAERLVVDAAHELIGKGHDVAFHVPVAAGALAFDDIPAGMPFHRAGAWVPEHVGGRLRLPFAIARTLTAARSLVSTRPGYDVIICDVVPHVIPWLKRRTSARLLYFGHFPDLPLTRTPRDDWYGWYRGPLDRWQSRGLAAADRILVNSRFTASAFRDAFPNLGSAPLVVVHPGITAPSCAAGRREGHRYESPSVGDDAIVLLAMGRYDPRKNLPLAIQTFDALRGRVAPDVFTRMRLVFIGHLDKRAPEARQVREELEQEARARHLERQVSFVESPTDAEQAAWLDRALVVVYTPTAEHFGIVPLEAMAAGRPVVAVNHGGPLETVVVGKTGLLCEASPDAFASAIARFVNEPELARRMGAEGRAHVDERFSRERFGDQLDAIVRQLAANRPGHPTDQPLSNTGRASLAHPSSQVGRADRRAPARNRVSSDGSSG
jgi:alpha-1,3/alpha-1,6-mannosyltransferase